jgi:aminopeptidase N
MKPTGLSLLFLFICGWASITKASAQTTTVLAIDVIHYDVQVEPDIIKKAVTGRVVIQLVSRVDNLVAIEFDCGALMIDAVRENKEALKFTRDGSRLNISLSRPAKAKERRKIEIEYHGSPRRGIRFFPDRGQVYRPSAPASGWSALMLRRTGRRSA